MRRADRGRLGAVDEDFTARAGTRRSRQFPCVTADLGRNHPGWRSEIVGRTVRRDLARFLHEIGPDGQRRFGAFQLQVAMGMCEGNAIPRPPGGYRLHRW